MLEEILKVLKDINENLKGGVPEIIQNPTVKVETSETATIATATMPVGQPVEEVPQPQPVAIAPVIPTAEPTGYTQEQLAVAMSNAVSAGKMNLIQEIMAQFGVQALTQLDPSRYNELAAKLKESGVQI